VRRPAVRSPLHDLVLRVERTRGERIRDAAATLGIGLLLLATLLPTACAAMRL